MVGAATILFGYVAAPMLLKQMMFSRMLRDFSPITIGKTPRPIIVFPFGS